MTSTTPHDAHADRARRIRELSKAHVFTSWSAQRSLDPLPIAQSDVDRLYDRYQNVYGR